MKPTLFCSHNRPPFPFPPLNLQPCGFCFKLGILITGNKEKKYRKTPPDVIIHHIITIHTTVSTPTGQSVCLPSPTAHLSLHSASSTAVHPLTHIKQRRTMTSKILKARSPSREKKRPAGREDQTKTPSSLANRLIQEGYKRK